jgi:hypothetical protein
MGLYAIAIYCDSSANYCGADPEILKRTIDAIQSQLRCTVMSEILPQALIRTYIKKQKVRKLTSWVLEIKVTQKWGGDWLHSYSGPSVPTDQVDEVTRGPTNIRTDTMNTVRIPHPTKRESDGKPMWYNMPFTLALPGAGKKEILESQEPGGLAREERKILPRAIYLTGISLSCPPEKFLRMITPKIVETAEAAGNLIPEINRPPPPTCRSKSKIMQINLQTNYKHANQMGGRTRSRRKGTRALSRHRPTTSSRGPQRRSSSTWYSTGTRAPPPTPP